jgi:excinuclease ABC subunit C
MEIRIDAQQAVYSLIGNIQEETHRFAISYHRALRSQRLRYSELDNIPGIGPKRKQELIKHFKSLATIKSATISELERLLPSNVAEAVYRFYHSNEEG